MHKKLIPTPRENLQNNETYLENYARKIFFSSTILIRFIIVLFYYCSFIFCLKKNFSQEEKKVLCELALLRQSSPEQRQYLKSYMSTINVERRDDLSVARQVLRKRIKSFHQRTFFLLLYSQNTLVFINFLN